MGTDAGVGGGRSDATQVGAALAQMCASALGLVGIVVVFVRLTGLAATRLLSVVWRPTLAALLMVTALLLLDDLAIRGNPGLAASLRLLGLIGVGAITYTAAAMLIWRLAGRPEGAESTLLAYAIGRIARR